MKVILTVHRYAPVVSGSEVYFTELAERLASRGHDVAVMTSDITDWAGVVRYEPRVELRNGVRVLRLPYKNFGERPFFSFARSLTRGSRIGPLFRDPLGWKVFLKLSFSLVDVVHTTCLPRSCVAGSILSGRLRRVPVVVTPFYHFSDPAFVSAAAPFMPLLRRSSRVLACSDSEARSLARVGVPEELITCIGAGVDFDFIQKTPPSNWREKLDVPRGAFTVLFISATLDNPGKGVRELIAASARLPEVHFVFAGGSEGEWADLRRIHALGPNCHYAGFVSGAPKAQLLKFADVLAMPSISDAFGMVYLEALAAGRPVITSDIESMTELYSDVGVNVPHGSTAALTGAIQTLQNDVSLYRRLASRAVEKASRYDWNLIVDRVEAVYREVAARNQPE